LLVVPVSPSSKDSYCLLLSLAPKIEKPIHQLEAKEIGEDPNKKLEDTIIQHITKAQQLNPVVKTEHIFSNLNPASVIIPPAQNNSTLNAPGFCLPKSTTNSTNLLSPKNPYLPSQNNFLDHEMPVGNITNSFTSQNLYFPYRYEKIKLDKNDFLQSQNTNGEEKSDIILEKAPNKVSADDNKVKCFMCHDGSTENLQVGRCGHAACNSCWKTWLITKKKSECPVCQRSVKVDELITLHF